jgi:hypothetical protein
MVKERIILPLQHHFLQRIAFTMCISPRFVSML